MNVIPYKTKRRTVRVPRPLRTLRVPRLIGRPNGEYRLTRTLNYNLAVVAAGTGFNVGGGNFPSVSIVFDPTGANIFGSAVNFVNIPMTNAAELSALWERTRIDKVELTFAPRFQQADGVALATSACPQYVICNDINDGAAGTTLANVLQHTDCKHVSTERPYVHTVYPKFQRLVYYTSLLSSYEPSRGFVDSATAIPHYSVHLALLDAPILAAGSSLTITMKYFMTCANVK